eukprot:scaffold303_cov202-Pinguiococcus_pyrenoidosus.AAC.2
MEEDLTDPIGRSPSSSPSGSSKSLSVGSAVGAELASASSGLGVGAEDTASSVGLRVGTGVGLAIGVGVGCPEALLVGVDDVVRGVGDAVGLSVGCRVGTVDDEVRHVVAVVLVGEVPRAGAPSQRRVMQGDDERAVTVSRVGHKRRSRRSTRRVAVVADLVGVEYATCVAAELFTAVVEIGHQIAVIPDEVHDVGDAIEGQGIQLGDTDHRSVRMVRLQDRPVVEVIEDGPGPPGVDDSVLVQRQAVCIGQYKIVVDKCSRADSEVRRGGLFHNREMQQPHSVLRVAVGILEKDAIVRGEDVEPPVARDCFIKCLGTERTSSGVSPSVSFRRGRPLLAGADDAQRTGRSVADGEV